MLALLSCAFCMASCDVHEFPDIPEKRAFHLRLNYDTDMTEWKHLYDGENMIEEGLGGVCLYKGYCRRLQPRSNP